MIEAVQPIAIFGDTQETIFIERLMGREVNRSESHQLMNDLAAQKPKAVFGLGDFVSYGFSQHDWRRFDQLMKPLYSASIPVYGLLGNHDYWGGDEGLKLAYQRFPQLQKSHWYHEQISELAFIMLDTNKSRLSKIQWEEQKEWFKNKLGELDQASSVKGIVVLTHHPPYSNSQVTGADQSTQDEFVPIFDQAKKTLAFISGHAHGYEHFHFGSKHYLVSGGAGGPRVSYHVGKEQKYKDLYPGKIPRPFNYLLFMTDKSGVKVMVRGFDKNETQARILDEISMPFSPGVQ